jgi:mono/diheme cytochrome c family protein/cytochrome c553
MEKLVRYFFLLSFILLAITGMLLFREGRPDWKSYQENYRDYLSEQTATAAEKTRVSQFEIGIKQDWLPEFDRADRCRSCHIGVDNPDASLQAPLTSHPDISPHSFEKFGCTACHEGDGFATRLPDAHDDLLPGQLIEASCGKCHGLEGPGTEEAPTYSAGYELLDEKTCTGCHLLSGEKKSEFNGPSLLGINSKVSKEWLVKWLQEPKNYLPASRMANFLLKKEEIGALVDFLFRQNMPEELADDFFKGNEAEQKILDDLSEDELDELVDTGKEIFGRLRCLSCHILNGKGGIIGPNLSKISQKTSRSWLSAWIKSPSTYNTHTKMPTFNMATMERLGLIEYLFWESEVDDLDEDDDLEESLPEQTVTEIIGSPDSGRDIFLAKGCVNCHQLPDIKANPEFAPSLKSLADKHIEKIDFGKTEIPRTLPDYIAVKLQNPRVYGDKLKMPYFGFSPEEVGRLTTILLGRSDSVPSSYQQQKQTVNIPPAAGEVGKIFKRYKCLSCHQLGGQGGKLAPDLTFEGSKTRKEWLKNYLEKPYAIRPYLVERMPRFNMTNQEAEIVAEYAELVLRNNEIDETPHAQEGNPAIGRRLYFDKYVCQSCHSIDGNGGYYGPALEGVSNRRKSAWLDTRLVNPHPYDSDAREPALSIPDEERKNILAFLSTLKAEERP